MTFKVFPRIPCEKIRMCRPKAPFQRQISLKGTGTNIAHSQARIRKPDQMVIVIMKLLLAYDGSKCAESALDDLTRAGLPERCEAVVISVAEGWLHSYDRVRDNGTGTNLLSSIERSIQKHHEDDRKLVAEAQTFASHAKQRLHRAFPKWTVSAESTYGSPAWEILSRADKLNADLIVVGSHGRSSISRLFLGSISQKVLSEAKCSVRVARGRIEVDPAPIRLIIGFDGSPGAHVAVDAVMTRTWEPFSEVRLIVATEQLEPLSIGRFVRPVTRFVGEVNSSERYRLESLAEEALGRLKTQGMSGTAVFRAGNPKQVLVEEAEHWNADCIFVGANSFGSQFERFLLGSTSAAVAARGHCSVEVTRAT